MNMIEVDPKLFITCRLCVEETGVYQIVPELQKKIKYCFDLEISLFDGLPPLICKKCQLMLSQHAEIKETLHEKQKKLIKSFKENPVIENITEEQISELPVPQIDIQKNDNNNYNENKKGNSLKSKKCKLNSHKSSSIDKSSPHADHTEPVPFTNVETVPLKNVESAPFKNEESAPFKNEEPVPFNNVNKPVRNGWRKHYKRQFVCRFCSISLRHKRSMVCHGERCVLMQKYAEVYKSCWVRVANINSKCNFTESTDHIVHERNKIVNTSNPNYYVIYSLKQEKKKSCSESSEENFARNKKKCKRQRLISESSDETLVIDNVLDKENNKTIFNAQRDIEYVTLDDSDNASTVSTATMKPENFKNERMVNNIVSICHSKYLKRHNVGGNHSKSCSSDELGNLQRKLLSIGRKVIHKDGFNQTGLLRYIEQRDLDVIWTPKLETNVSIITTLKENKQHDDEIHLKSLCLIDNDYKPRDFVDIFEQKPTLETNSTKCNLRFCNDNVVQEELSNKKIGSIHSKDNLDSSSNYIVHNTEKETAQKTNLVDITKVISTYEKVNKNSVVYLQAPKETTNLSNAKKLLNSTPVANPKKLTKKAVSELTTNSNTHGETNVNDSADSSSVFDACSPLPIITSTVSLALPVNNVNSTEQSTSGNEAAQEIPETPLPRIKVKPVSELMAPTPDKPKGAQVPANVWAGNSNVSQQQFIPSILPNLLLSPSPVYVSLVQPNNVTAPQFQSSRTNSLTQVTYSNSVQTAPQVNNNLEYITMHTVELPRKKTHSPFLYFRELLQIHNMNLIDSTAPTSHMCCIIKFKLRFEQAGTASVTLCLSLLCYINTFCIQVKDLQSRILDVNDFSAYWQWEVLKGFKGDVIGMMLQNAKKYSNEMLEKTTYFVSLLNNIMIL